MRLTPIEPENPTFTDHDFLKREDTGKQLTRLIQTVHSPLVIAVDGEWGSGKSHFLKCWNNEPKNNITSVYVDAFKQDYLDDPLIALVAALDQAVDTDAPVATQTAMKKLKVFAPIAGRFAVRAGIKWLTKETTEEIREYFSDSAASSAQSSAEEAVNDAGKALIDATDDFWKSETSRRKAMEAFRDALIELTQPDGDGTPTHSITLIVDELDRCRPDYALNMLEVIKHFFDIDGINFVLGVNLASLENSVKARYGGGINAKKYLTRFIQFSLRLPLSKDIDLGSALSFFNETIKSLEVETERTFLLRTYIEQMEHSHTLSLRGIQRVISNCIASGLMKRFSLHQQNQMEHALLTGVQILKVFHPELVGDRFSRELTFGNVANFFGIEDPTYTSAPESDAIAKAWCLYLEGSDNVYRNELIKNLVRASPRTTERYYHGFNRDKLRELIETRIDTISLND